MFKAQYWTIFAQGTFLIWSYPQKEHEIWNHEIYLPTNYKKKVHKIYIFKKNGPHFKIHIQYTYIKLYSESTVMWSNLYTKFLKHNIWQHSANQIFIPSMHFTWSLAPFPVATTVACRIFPWDFSGSMIPPFVFSSGANRSTNTRSKSGKKRLIAEAWWKTKKEFKHSVS